MRPSFEEMVEAAARYRFEGNRGYHYSHGSRVVREVLIAAGVPELLAEVAAARAVVEAADHEDIAGCQTPIDNFDPRTNEEHWGECHKCPGCLLLAAVAHYAEVTGG